MQDARRRLEAEKSGGVRFGHGLALSYSIFKQYYLVSVGCTNVEIECNPFLPSQTADISNAIFVLN